MIYKDVLALQTSFSAGRGIGRFVSETVLSLEESLPGLVSAYVYSGVLGDRPAIEHPGIRTRLAAREEIATSPAVFHITSPFEARDVDLLLPWWARDRRTRTVATLYDLIPLRFPRWYPAAQGREYRNGLELVRQADQIVTLSESAKADAVELLGIKASRVTVIGAGVSATFASGGAAHGGSGEEAVEGVPPGFCLYVGGVDPRKNMERLVRAYAKIPSTRRSTHPLVIVCSIEESDRARLLACARECGLRGGELVLLGRVDDDVLVRLYRQAALFVFPSAYEGFGLPVAEAIACGTPVVVGRNSSLVELVHDERCLFDVNDIDDIARTLDRCLESPPPVPALSDEHRWPAVARRLASVYDLVRRTPPPRPRRRPRLAYVSPMPPAASGVADYSYRMVEALLEFADVDVFADGPHPGQTAPDGALVAPVSEFEWWETHRRGYDGIICCVGNSSNHDGALAILRARSAIVVLHDVHLPAVVGDLGATRRLVERAPVVIVHSEDARRLLAEPPNVRVLPLAAPAPWSAPEERRSAPTTIVSFGIAAPIKQSDKVVAAFRLLADRHPDWVLAFVGPVMQGFDERMRSAVGSAAVVLTGRVDEGSYRQWLARSSIAVQLRDRSRGETSGAVLDCLAAGVPTVVSRIGSADELPAEVVVKVERDVCAADLARCLEDLAADDGRRRELARAAQQYVDSRPFSATAARYIELLCTRFTDEVGARRRPIGVPSSGRSPR